MTCKKRSGISRLVFFTGKKNRQVMENSRNLRMAGVFCMSIEYPILLPDTILKMKSKN
jgi:hypothetical protein